MKTLKNLIILMMISFFTVGCASNGTRGGPGLMETAIGVGAVVLGVKGAKDDNAGSTLNALTNSNKLSRSFQGVERSVKSLTGTLESTRELLNTDIEYDADRDYRTEIGRQDVRDLQNARTQRRRIETRTSDYRTNTAFDNLQNGQVINTNDRRYQYDYNFSTPTYGGSSGANNKTQQQRTTGASSGVPPVNGVCKNGTTWREGMCYKR